MGSLTVNTTDLELRRARAELAGFSGSIDGKRPDANPVDEHGNTQHGSAMDPPTHQDLAPTQVAA